MSTPGPRKSLGLLAGRCLEVEVNPDHTPTEEHNQEGEPANNLATSGPCRRWKVPNQFYRPVRALEWFVDGSDFITFGWGYDGEQFGESTYYYELAITPIISMANDESATPEQAVIFDLEEDEIIHTSVTVGDFDEACTECALESYQGFWTMSPESCCTATTTCCWISYCRRWSPRPRSRT